MQNSKPSFFAAISLFILGMAVGVLAVLIYFGITARADTHDEVDQLTMTSVPVLEPTECKPDDKDCIADNINNAGKPAVYPTVCEPYIFPKGKK